MVIKIIYGQRDQKTDFFKMVLSDKVFMPGKNIYGSAETHTVDFVLFDSSDLEGK